MGHIQKSHRIHVCYFTCKTFGVEPPVFPCWFWQEFKLVWWFPVVECLTLFLGIFKNLAIYFDHRIGEGEFEFLMYF